MGYGRFVQELNKGIEGKIAAYSHRDNEEGCLIYLRNLEQRIFVPADVIENQRNEAILALREKICEGVGATQVLVLKRDGAELEFEDEAAANLRRSKYLTAIPISPHHGVLSTSLGVSG